MGDMAEYFNAMKEYNKRKRKENEEKYEPILEKSGAIKKALGVWELNDYFVYPTKCFAMHRKTYQKMNIDKFLQQINTSDSQ